MNRWSLMIRALFMAGLGFVLSGCGTRLVPVEGKVIFKDGAPLAGGMVVFSPVDKAVRTGGRAYVKEDGTFRLSTERADDGILAGRYRALVMPPPQKRGGDEDAPRPLIIDARYLQFETSGLEFELNDQNRKIVIEVERPGGPGRKR